MWRKLVDLLGGTPNESQSYTILNDDDGFLRVPTSPSSVHHLVRTPSFAPARLAVEVRAPAKDANSGDIGRSVMYGGINAVILLPAMVGFATIIYSDAFFEDNGYFPRLLKLLLFSSAVHQLAFTCLSSLPFAIGQVQDAGLIFLSSMATTIVANAGDAAEPAAVMATVVVSLSLCTVTLGLLLMLTGTLRLARLVQFLPFPVVGGYLAFIGQFCGQAGLALMADIEVRSVVDLPNLFDNWHRVLLLSPGVVCALLLMWITHRFRSVWVLPSCLVAMPISFFVILFASGHDLDDARESGWVQEPKPVPPFWEAFELFDFQAVRWTDAFPSIVPTFFAMVLVVAFGSCLDIAAIQYETERELDFDHELKTVGLSNALSGMSGGLTGSYIFSQTLFTMRNGIRSRACGFTVVVAELALFLTPVDLLSVLPLFFFGAVLLFIAIDLMLEWLVLSYRFVDPAEFFVMWGTFIAINALGLEAGMGIGVVLAALAFALSFARTQPTQLVRGAHSNIVRGVESRKLLSSLRGQIVVIRLGGYQFFGSTRAVTSLIDEIVVVEGADGTRRILAEHKRLGGGTLAQRPRRHTARSSPRGSVNMSPLSGHDTASAFDLEALSVLANAGASSGCSSRPPTAVVVLDWTDVPALDATAAKSCFLTLRQSLERVGVLLAFAGANARCERLLVAHEVLPLGADPTTAHHGDDGSLSPPTAESSAVTGFATLDAAMEWAEECVLATQGAHLQEGDSVSRRNTGYTSHCKNDAAPSQGLSGLLATFLGTAPPFSSQTLSARPSITHHLEPPQATTVGACVDKARTSDETSEQVTPSGSDRSRDDVISRAVTATTSPGQKMMEERALVSNDAEVATAAAARVRERNRNLLSPVRHSLRASTPPTDGERAADSNSVTTALSAWESEGGAPESLETFFERCVFEEGQVVFGVGEVADSFYLIERGEVVLYYADTGEKLTAVVTGDGGDRLLRYEGGGVVGDLDFILDRPRTFSCMARRHSTLHRCTRESLQTMKVSAPVLATALQDGILKSMAVSADLLLLGRGDC